MTPLPFYIVTLTHPEPEEGLTYGRRLGDDALPELRLDLWPDRDPAEMVQMLQRRCLVTCRRASEGGRWPDADEAGRMAHLKRAAEARPAWIDLEWDLAVPAWFEAHRTHTRLLRSVHVRPGVFDLETRLKALPEGDAWKWVGHAERLGDNARLKGPLAWAHDHELRLSAFLMGPKGMVSRVMQGAWNGAFTYACPDDGPPAAPGQLPLATLRSWRVARLHKDHGICGVIGSPVLHSRSPEYHTPRFQRSWKDLVYLPLECAEAEEAVEALDALPVLGLSITAPLKMSLPEALGLRGPTNTLWRRQPGDPWEGVNTDTEALLAKLKGLPKGPVLILGDGGVANASRDVVEAMGFTAVLVKRRAQPLASTLATLKPVGVIQATSLGMDPGDPVPYPELLSAALPSLKWAVEWVYKEKTAFARWVKAHNLSLVDGEALFELQAEAQSRRFIAGCGG
ncbi:MAG: type I 3-dehydroquinate dehydratase [Acidobacteria bacterium]|nr:type I 3-dehydroquinate dehydratase [Acidobacteriota bacterium]